LLVPSIPVPGITAHNTGPTTIKVWWNSPNEKDIPGIFTGYAVYYKEVSSDSDYWYPGEIRNTSTLYYLSNLKPYTNYTVNITVSSLEGEGIPATLYVTTEEGGEFPFMLPTDFQFCCLVQCIKNLTALY